MNRTIQWYEKIFIAGLVIIFVFNLIHDWVPLGTLNDLEGIRSHHSVADIVTITITNVLSILIVLVLALWFAGRRYPLWARIWLVVHIGSILIGALSAWWIPYLTGAGADMVAEYQTMFGNTHAFLPEMNGIVPNTLHVAFHTVLFAVWALAVYIIFRQPPKEFHLDWASASPTSYS